MESKEDKTANKSQEKTLKDLLKGVEIKNPLKDFRITHNQFDIVIKKGEPVTVPSKFLQNLVTEKVIDKLPK